MMQRRNVRTGALTSVAILGAAVLSILPSFPRSASAQDTLPVGYGTLKRDDIVVRFATDQLEIQVLPLAERSEEHTSELQSQSNLVCRLLLEKKKKNNTAFYTSSLPMCANYSTSMYRARDLS